MKACLLIFILLACFLSACSRETTGIGRSHRGTLRSTPALVGIKQENHFDSSESVRVLEPHRQLDSALREQLYTSYDQGMEEFELDRAKPKNETPVFQLKPKDEKGPIIFLKPVKR